MRLERPEVVVRHRGVRPVFLIILALAFGICVVHALRVQRPRPAPAGIRLVGTPADDWLASHRAHCNAVEVTTLLLSSDPGADASGAAQRAACLAIAGKLDAAREVIRRLPHSERNLAVNRVFDAAHPVADAGDDTSAGPIMELVIEFQPNQYMALYHAGMAAAAMGDDERARSRLSRFLEIYRFLDGWTHNARKALDALDRPPTQRFIKQSAEGSVVY